MLLYLEQFDPELVNAVAQYFSVKRGTWCCCDGKSSNIIFSAAKAEYKSNPDGITSSHQWFSQAWALAACGMPLPPLQYDADKDYLTVNGEQDPIRIRFLPNSEEYPTWFLWNNNFWWAAGTELDSFLNEKYANFVMMRRGNPKSTFLSQKHFFQTANIDLTTRTLNFRGINMLFARVGELFSPGSHNSSTMTPPLKGKRELLFSQALMMRNGATPTQLDRSHMHGSLPVRNLIAHSFAHSPPTYDPPPALPPDFVLTQNPPQEEDNYADIAPPLDLGAPAHDDLEMIDEKGNRSKKQEISTPFRYSSSSSSSSLSETSTEEDDDDDDQDDEDDLSSELSESDDDDNNTASNLKVKNDEVFGVNKALKKIQQETIQQRTLALEQAQDTQNDTPTLLPQSFYTQPTIVMTSTTPYTNPTLTSTAAITAQPTQPQPITQPPQPPTSQPITHNPKQASIDHQTKTNDNSTDSESSEYTSDYDSEEHDYSSDYDSDEDDYSDEDYSTDDYSSEYTSSDDEDDDEHPIAQKTSSPNLPTHQSNNTSQTSSNNIDLDSGLPELPSVSIDILELENSVTDPQLAAFVVKERLAIHGEITSNRSTNSTISNTPSSNNNSTISPSQSNQQETSRDKVIKVAPKKHRSKMAHTAPSSPQTMRAARSPVKALDLLVQSPSGNDGDVKKDQNVDKSVDTTTKIGSTTPQSQTPTQPTNPPTNQLPSIVDKDSKPVGTSQTTIEAPIKLSKAKEKDAPPSYFDAVVTKKSSKSDKNSHKTTDKSDKKVSKSGDKLLSVSPPQTAVSDSALVNKVDKNDMKPSKLSAMQSVLVPEALTVGQSIMPCEIDLGKGLELDKKPSVLLSSSSLANMAVNIPSITITPSATSSNDGAVVTTTTGGNIPSEKSGNDNDQASNKSTAQPPTDLLAFDYMKCRNVSDLHAYITMLLLEREEMEEKLKRLGGK